MKERHYNVWVVFSPSKGLPGQWVGHCLEFDVFSQGDSLQHAMNMIGEATSMVVLHDLQHGRDPVLRRAPEKYFEQLSRMQTNGERVPLDLAFEDKTGKRIYAMPLRLKVVEVQVALPKKHAAKAVAKSKAQKVKPQPASEVAFAQASC